MTDKPIAIITRGMNKPSKRAQVRTLNLRLQAQQEELQGCTTSAARTCVAEAIADTRRQLGELTGLVECKVRNWRVRVPALLVTRPPARGARGWDPELEICFDVFVTECGRQVLFYMGQAQGFIHDSDRY